MNVPSGYTALDLVGFTDRGTYSNLTNYVKNDLVHYGGDIWKCLLDDTTNKTPAEGTYWTLWIDNNTTADSVSYNNTQSGLSATNVKGAIDEVSSDIQTLSNLRAKLGAHNLFDFTFYTSTLVASGVTFVVNTDGTITANGQSTASPGSTSRISSRNLILKAGSYIFSAGLPATGSDTTYYCFLYDYTNAQRIATVYADEEVAFTVNSDITFTVYTVVCRGYTANNIVYKPMIRDARDTDKAFAPFSKSNVELTKDTKGLLDNVNVMGAKNLLPINLSDIIANNTQGTWSGNQYTRNGVTFTVNDDGTVTANGTSDQSASVPAIIYLRGKDGLRAKSPSNPIILSGCPSGGDWNGYSISAVCGSASTSGNIHTEADFGEGVEISDAYFNMYIRVAQGTTVSNLTFKPMLRLASDTDPTYQPYAMTNKELTDVAKQVEGGYMLKSYSSVTVTADGTKTFKTLLNELYAAISQVFTNNPNSHIKILTLRTESNYYPIYVVPQLRPSVVSNWVFQGFTFGGTNYISIFSVESSNSSVKRCDIGAGTLVDISTDVPSSGTTFIVQYEIYKQIS